MDWLQPWWSVVERPDLASAYKRELLLELGDGHPLKGLPVVAIGKHDGSDDVLFSVNDGSGRVAVVHLTWAQHPEPLPWPATEFFADLEAFSIQRMKQDHDDHH